MTQQTRMPEPVATVFGERIHRSTKIKPQDGDTLITTEQAEAYKDACVREALEEAAQAADTAWRASIYDFPLPHILAAIRALIQPTKESKNG